VILNLFASSFPRTSEAFAVKISTVRESCDLAISISHTGIPLSSITRAFLIFVSVASFAA
jgi:hypothetical protein